MKENRKTIYSIIRYAGGKTRAQKILEKYIPKDVKKVVSPFIGGGVFELYLNKYRDIEIDGYDIFDYLVNFWQVILNENTKEKFIKEILKYIPNRDFYYQKREELLDIYKNNKDIDKIKKATLYYFSHQFSYGPMFLGWPSSAYLKEKIFQNKIEKIRDFKVNKFSVKQSDFEAVIKNNPNEFLYLDPPYFLDGDSKVFKGIYPNTNWAIHHKNFNHDLLNKLLKNHKGGFVLSYNNCDDVKEMYKGYEFVYPKWNYSFSSGEKRIGETRKTSDNYNKESHEILIISYKK
jgi:DNA adenine methylase